MGGIGLTLLIPLFYNLDSNSKLVVKGVLASLI